MREGTLYSGVKGLVIATFGYSGRFRIELELWKVVPADGINASGYASYSREAPGDPSVIASVRSAKFRTYPGEHDYVK